MTDESPKPARSTAAVPTEHASRYLQQLCKHFAHKLPVTFDPKAGSIAFPIGTCRLAATDTVLTLDLETPNAGDMAQLQDVVVRHLVRFAFREELAVDWTEMAGQGA
jgi:hypothetical protein